jgi:ribosomal-protein-alanine N-acetyltransferase
MPLSHAPQILLLTERDALWLHELHKACFVPHDVWTAESFASLLAEPTVLGLTTENRAALILLRCVADEAEILTLCTHPQHRGQKLAWHLVQAALTQALAQSVQSVFLEVEAENSAARALYGGCGFIEAGQRAHYYGLNRHALLLRYSKP